MSFILNLVTLYLYVLYIESCYIVLICLLYRILLRCTYMSFILNLVTLYLYVLYIESCYIVLMSFILNLVTLYLYVLYIESCYIVLICLLYRILLRCTYMSFILNLVTLYLYSKTHLFRSPLNSNSRFILICLSTS